MLYDFWMYNPATAVWTELQSYSTSASCSWTAPPQVGSYMFNVTAKQIGDLSGYNVTSKFLNISVVQALVSVSLSATPASPREPDMPITLTATATGGIDVLYTFTAEYRDTSGTDHLLTLSDSSASSTCVWQPAVVATYTLTVSAREANKPAQSTSISSSMPYVIAPPVSAVSLAVSPASPATVNTPITLTLTATGGTTLEYQFWVYNAAATPAWVQLQPYSSNNSCAWTPTVAGTYLLSATELDTISGVEMNTMAWYTIANPTLTGLNVTFNPASSAPANSSITITAAAVGGTNVQYQFWVYNASAVPAWTQLQTYSSSPTCLWTPTTAGAYYLSITALDGLTRAIVNYTQWYTVGVAASSL